MVKAGVGFRFLMRLSMVGEIGRSPIGGVLSVNGGVGLVLVECEGTILDRVGCGMA